MRSATASARRPSAVVSQPAAVRTSTRPPIASSSDAIRRDTVEWLTPSTSAAAV